MADVASLAVALHLNSASFKSQFAEAMRTADSSSKSFNQKAQDSAAKTKSAFEDIGKGVSSLDADFNSLGNTVDKRLTGLDEMRNVLTSLSSGSMVGGSSVTSALISALGEGMSTALGNSMSSLEAQRQAQINFTAAQVDSARSVVENARRLREEAQAKAAIAVKTIQMAKADRERALALDEYLIKQSAVNKEFGISVSYQDEHNANSRAINEANIAEAKGKQDLADAAKTVLESDMAESDGKQLLIQKIRDSITASAGLTLAQRAAAISAGVLRGALAMVGGPIGLGIMVTAGAVTALYQSFANAEERVNGFTAAINKSGNQSALTLNDIEQLNARLGATSESVTAVTAAVGAGFGGSLLEQVSELGTKMEENGQSSADLVSMLSQLSGDPLQAMQSLTTQGIMLNSATIQQIVTLQRQGRETEATTLLQKTALDAVKAKVDEQDEGVSGLANTWNSLKNSISSAFDTISSARIAVSQAGAAAAGADSTISNDPAEAARKAMEERQKALDKEREAIQQQLKDETAVSAAIKAGTDPKKEAAKTTELLNQRYKAGKITLAEYQQGLKGIEKQLGENKKTASYRDDSATRRLAELRQQEAVLREQATATATLTEAERKLLQFNQEITVLKRKKVLTTDQRSILNAEQELRTQLSMNASLARANEQRKMALELQQQTVEIHRSTRELEQEYSNQVSQMTMTSAAYSQMVAEQEVRERFAKAREDLDKKVLDKSSARYSSQTEILKTEEQKQLEIVRSGALKKREIEKSGIDGFRLGMAQWGEDAENTFASVRDATGSAMDSMSSSIWKLASTGKANFKDMATSIINDLGQMVTKLLLFNSIKAGATAMGVNSFFGWAEGGYTGDGGKHDVAGVVHRGEWVVPQRVVKQPGMLGFLNHLTYGKGYAEGGLVGGTGQAFSNRGAGQSSASGGLSVEINIPLQVIQSGAQSGQNQGNDRQNSALGSEARGFIKRAVMETLDRELSDGGMIDLRLRSA